MHAWASAAEIAGAVADGKVTAVAVVEAAFARITQRNDALGAVASMADSDRAFGILIGAISCSRIFPKSAPGGSVS